MRSATNAGVTVERFWQLTPAEILIEIDAWKKREEILDYRTGLLCAVICEKDRDESKRQEAFTPADFMPKRGQSEQKKQQTADEQLQIIQVLNAAFGGEVVISDG